VSGVGGGIGSPGAGKGNRILIAGAGLAGLRAAQAARGAGHAGEIVLIGDEPHAPYTRPPLSKELLTGTHSPEGCQFPGIDVLEAELRLGTAVMSVDAADHSVTLSDGSTLAYGRLIIATGARARRLPIAAGAQTLRNLHDAAQLNEALGRARRLAIIGAGFIGCEVAASARARSVDVDVIDIAPHPLLPLGPELAERVADVHRGHDVTLHLSAGVERVDDEGVALSDGTLVPADCVLVAVGAAPNTEMLRGSGIELAADGAVLCDATLTSISDPDVLAAGDVASWPHPGAGGERVRVEHWTTAAEHGRLAGANATREPAERTPHVAPPYFWSDHYELKIQSVGFPARAARIEIVEEDEDGRLLAEALSAEGELIGAVAFNHARRLAEYRRRLAATTANA
jgi:3-phenylpropionate/trans-cinnamate dioxygenase ferredoxin reductase component